MRTYSCARVSPSDFAARDLLKRASASAFSIISRSTDFRSRPAGGRTASVTGVDTGAGEAGSGPGGVPARALGTAWVSAEVGGDQAAVAQDRRALDRVAQLAHVARPVVVHQRVASREMPAGGRPIDAAELGEEAS